LGLPRIKRDYIVVGHRLYENAAVPLKIGKITRRRKYCSMKYYIGCDAHKKYSVFADIEV